MAYVILVLGLLGIADTTGLILFDKGLNFGATLPGVVGVVLVFLAWLKLSGRIKSFRIENRFLKSIAIAVLVVFTVSFVWIESLIIMNGRAETNLKADYLVILGAGLDRDQPRASLQERLEKGLAYAQEYPDVPIVVSGGQGVDELISEAEAMKRWLVARGIREDRIIMEDKSSSTMENFAFSKQKMTHKGSKLKIAVITNDFHMYRSLILARKNGFEAFGISCRTPVSVVFNCYLREYFAVIKSLIFDRA